VSVCVCVCVCVCLCVCVWIYTYIWVIYVTYNIKQVRYSGVNDGNTSIKHTPSHKQIHTMRLKTSQFIWDHSCRLSFAYAHGPTHAQVQITWSSVSISSSSISSFQGKHTLLPKSFVSGLLTNPRQNYVTIHRLWPQLTLIDNWNFTRSTSIQRSMLKMFRPSWSGVRRPKRYATHVGYLFPHLTSLIIFPSFFQEDVSCAWIWSRPEV